MKKTDDTQRQPQVGSDALLSELDAEARLMQAAKKFAMAFDENHCWSEGKRLEYTLYHWRELALAAVEFSRVHSDNDQGQVTANP